MQRASSSFRELAFPSQLPGSCRHSRPGEAGPGDERRKTAGPPGKLTSMRQVLAGSVRMLLHLGFHGAPCE